MFNAQRNSLSGSNSKVSSSDSTHPRLYIECKLKAKDALWTLHDDTKKKAKIENKTPIIAISRKGSPGAMICVHTDNVEAFISEWLIANGGSALILSHQLPTIDNSHLLPHEKQKRDKAVADGRARRKGKDKLLPMGTRKRKKGKL